MRRGRLPEPPVIDGATMALVEDRLVGAMRAADQSGDQRGLLAMRHAFAIVTDTAVSGMHFNQRLRAALERNRVTMKSPM